MKALIKNTVRRLGYDLVKCPSKTNPQHEAFPDMTARHLEIMDQVKPFTMTGPERVAALINAVNYLSENSIVGDIAECGVWRGGSVMTVALTLLANNDTDRHIYLYDTFEGMSSPTSSDIGLDGVLAADLLDKQTKGTGVWCYASIEDVRANMLATGYPQEKIHFVKGKVEETIPDTVPSSLALLRLDTDWYESTRHELTNLYPKLEKHGILIIDDYGHWRGAKRAVDEYFKKRAEKIFLHRIDYTARIMVKTIL